jgi:DNA-binding transcriptional LysR family regulator
MNLLHLRYFFTVAQHGSFTKASKVLLVAQPSLSKSIRLLEDSLDLKLFDRTTREVHLTSDGAVLFEHAQSVFAQVEQLERVLKRHVISPQKPLPIGAGDAFASIVVPKILAGFLKSWPACYPVIQSGTATEICHLIERRKLEMAFLFHAPDLSSRLHSQNIKRVRFYLVANRSGSKNPKTLAFFIGSREVDEEGSKRFPTLERWRKIAPNAQIQLSSNSLLTHLQLVREGIGVSVLPEFLVEKDLRRGSLVDLLPKEELAFPLKLITHAHYPLSPVAKSLADAVTAIL